MATDAPTGPATGWRVTAQQETMLPGASGQFTKGVQVMFTTAKGNTASVFCPDAQYSTEVIRGLIAAKAAVLDATSDLAG
jgi:hypothetical protein